jgi:hypothetical protein
MTLPESANQEPRLTMSKPAKSIVEMTGSAPVGRATTLTERDLEMFARIGVPLDLLEAAHVERVSDRDARERFGIVGPASKNMAGIVFPYDSHVTGLRVTARVRRDNPELEDGRPKNKYVSAYGDARHLYFPPDAQAKLAGPETPIALVEAEKSALALTAWGARVGIELLAVAMGGCWGWRGRIGKTEGINGARVDVTGPLPDLSVCDGRTVYVCLDANAATNSKVQAARAVLVRELRKRGCNMLLCSLPLADGVNGPDDLIAVRGDEAMQAVFDDATARIETGRTVADSSGAYVADSQTRPPLHSAALYGLAGDVVRIIEPHSEADPAAILIQTLTAVGNMIGPSLHCTVEATRHALVLFAVLVGETSKGRKGTSWGHIERLCSRVDAEWGRERVTGGLSSAEGLIAEVRDDTDQPRDRRLLIVQPEFASVLRVMGRDGNNLSPLLRSAWDSGNLRTLVKHDPLRATGAHISVVGHITRMELLRYLSDTEQHNGFANRLLWCCIKRSKFLPEGGRIPEAGIATLADRLCAVIQWAREKGEMEMWRDEAARGLWAAVYPRLSEGLPGLLGAATSRAEAQVLRLSAVYAVLDCSATVRVEHLRAALAVWDYCFASARFIFGDATGNPVADRIREALQGAGPDGVTRTQIRDLLGRHASADRIAQALDQLAALGVASHRTVSTDGRSIEIWTATEATKATKG